MKKSACLFIAMSFIFVAMSAEAKPAKKAEKSLLRVHYMVDGKETKVKEMSIKKGEAVQITVDPNTVEKALKVEPCKEAPCKAAKKPEPKVKAPAAPAPSASEEVAPEPEDEETPDPVKEERTDLVPAPTAPIPTEPQSKCESHFYEKWWFWTLVAAGAGVATWKVGDHNGWWDIHYGGHRR